MSISGLIVMRNVDYDYIKLLSMEVYEEQDVVIMTTQTIQMIMNFYSL